jgi:mannose-6-phosphate isomerase
LDIFELVKLDIEQNNLSIASFDLRRPWGGFFVIEETQAEMFAGIYFNGLSIETLKVAGKLSPKLLLVKPGARLSWQYHHRRAEIWKVIQGPVGIITSLDDTEGDLITYQNGDIIGLQQGERHRLIGSDNWGVVAEFWQHTDVTNPSDEEDIVRVQDDYFRK